MGAFLREVRALMMGFAQESAAGADIPRRPSSAAQKRILRVETASRASGESHRQYRRKILDAELTARPGRDRVAQDEPSYRSSDVVEVLSRRSAIGPVITELKGHRQKGRGGRSRLTNPYADAWAAKDVFNLVGPAPHVAAAIPDA